MDIDIRHSYSSETKTALNEYSWRKYARWFHRIDKSFPQYQILIEEFFRWIYIINYFKLKFFYFWEDWKREVAHSNFYSFES